MIELFCVSKIYGDKIMMFSLFFLSSYNAYRRQENCNRSLCCDICMYKKKNRFKDELVSSSSYRCSSLYINDEFPGLSPQLNVILLLRWDLPAAQYFQRRESRKGIRLMRFLSQYFILRNMYFVAIRICFYKYRHHGKRIRVRVSLQLETIGYY